MHTIGIRVRASSRASPSGGPAFASFTYVSMALKSRIKKTIIGKHQSHKKDTGSAQVQVALLTKQISLLTDHLKDHKKDHSARRGLLGKVAQRRNLLMYLKRDKPTVYQKTIEKNKLKK